MIYVLVVQVKNINIVMAKFLDVVVGVVQDCNGLVLIAKRPPHVRQPGLWEFPGGKVEANESIPQAIVREFQEEIAITVLAWRPLIKTYYRYPDETVLLHVYLITEYQGQAYGNEGQEIRWVSIADLKNYDCPRASRAIINALQLPDYYVITPPIWQAEYLKQMQHVLANGNALVQLRVPNMKQQEYQSLANDVLQLCRHAAVKLLLNADITAVETLHADGVHLTSEQLLQLSVRPLSAQYWVAASCHNEKELQHAAHIGVDFVVLGPVLATASHVGHPGLGWLVTQQLLMASSVPVYLIGGMKHENLTQAQQIGARGIAGIQTFWG